ncbi:MAG: hypothetical protein K6C14_02210, partial [Eubacterium sp.]|nr:hypothetical protein [Eubacterium sp.]
MTEIEIKYRKDGLPKQPLNLFEKIVVAISVILVIATAVVGIAKFGFEKMENISHIITDSLTA